MIRGPFSARAVPSFYLLWNMKFLLNRSGGWVFCWLVLGGCQESDAPILQHTPPSITPGKTGSLALVVTALDSHRARADFGGVWLNAEYGARLRRTRSPQQSHGHWGPDGVTLVEIDSGSFHGDSLRVEMGYGNHEGGPLYYLHLRPGYPGAILPATTERSLGQPPVSFRYRVQGLDTILYLHEPARPGQRTSISAFRKVRGLPVEKNNLDLPFGQYINRHMVAGTHAATDSAGHAFAVHFSAAGQVTGFPAHRRYGVNYDFVGPFHEYDSLWFDLGQPTEEVLAFVTRGDTMRLYRVRDDTTVHKRRLGNLRFTLVRQKP